VALVSMCHGAEAPKPREPSSSTLALPSPTSRPGPTRSAPATPTPPPGTTSTSREGPQVTTPSAIAAAAARSRPSSSRSGCSRIPLRAGLSVGAGRPRRPGAPVLFRRAAPVDSGEGGSPSERVDPFTEEELRRLLATCRAHYPQEYPLPLTLARTGIRKETVDIYRHWIPGASRRAVDRLDDPEPVLPATKRNAGATADDRIPASSRLS